MNTYAEFDPLDLELNPVLLKLAATAVARRNAASILDAFEDEGHVKQADPMGGGAPPMGGAAAPPPPDPMGGGPQQGPLDPAAVQQIAMAVGGGAGGAGKPGGKPPKEQIMSAQMYNLTFLVVQMAQKMGITVPPQMLLGPPPDPGISSMAQQDLGAATSAPNLAQDPNAQGGAPGGGGGAPGGAPPGPGMPQPPAPMDAGSGPIGKQGGVGIGVGREFSDADLQQLLQARQPGGDMLSQSRSLLLGIGR
jgi:hypothetical protein